ncbi:uncharacterized protein LOC142557284 [Dermacentor variabilis]|uniref:uncharacterized protein LOC142557284 n=1 Tax=Dermacentor variabilis TaxID=34621 RepID=UPI003F5BA318
MVDRQSSLEGGIDRSLKTVRTMEAPGDCQDVTHTAAETVSGKPSRRVAHYIDDRIRHIRGVLARSGINFDRACTFDANGDCWLSAKLTPWNKLIAPLGLELSELEPSKLYLRSINVDGRIQPDVKAVHESAYIFTWLPKQHACVQAIHLNENVLYQKPAYALKLALGESAGLRHLRLKGGYSTPFSERDLSAGMKPLAGLESFEFLKLDIASHNLAGDIAALLRRNADHLAKVAFERNALSQRSTATLLAALAKCEALAKLSFDHNHLNKANIAAMASVIRSCNQLKELSLRYSFGEKGHIGPIAEALQLNVSLVELKLHACEAPLAPLFKALETNATVRLLDLDSSTLSTTATACLAEALRHNKGLRSVALQHCSVADSGAVVLASVMAQNVTLETLDLSYNYVGLRGITAFCQALGKNDVLRRVTFESFEASDQERRDLAHLLNQCQCYGRIALPWIDVDLTPLTMALMLDSQSPLELELDETNELSCSLFCALFDALATNTVVRVLKVEARHYEPLKAEALRKVLISTESIKSLELQMGINSFEGSLLVDVSKALLVNTTVTELTIYTREVGLRSSKEFAKMLSHNRTLTRIVLHCQYLETKRLEMLSRGMIENRVVTSFTFNHPLRRNHSTFRLHEALRRNITLLNMAVKFVMQTNLTKHCAQAFEMLRGTSSLVSQVSKVCGKSEKDAVADIDAADKYIRSHYLYVTGVVRFSVKCYPSTQTQVDALNDYCWLAIAEFLKVSDVLDE